MRLHGAFIADGSSDLPLARHLEVLCADAGVEISLTPVSSGLLRNVGSALAPRLRCVATELGPLDALFVHRDAEAQTPDLRYLEIRTACEEGGVACPTVPVVPIRMTEAWLLLVVRR